MEDHSLDGNSIALLDAPLFENIGDSTSLPEEFRIRDLSRIRRFIRFIDNSSFFWVLVIMPIQTVVRGVQSSLRTSPYISATTPHERNNTTHNH